MEPCPSFALELSLVVAFVKHFLEAQTVRTLPAMQETLGSVPESGRCPEKGMATHSRIPACKIPWTEDPGGLYSPWGHKELDTTERLILLVLSNIKPMSFFFF